MCEHPTQHERACTLKITVLLSLLYPQKGYPLLRKNQMWLMCLSTQPAPRGSVDELPGALRRWRERQRGDTAEGATVHSACVQKVLVSRPAPASPLKRHSHTGTRQVEPEAGHKPATLKNMHKQILHTARSLSSTVLMETLFKNIANAQK